MKKMLMALVAAAAIMFTTSSSFAQGAVVPYENMVSILSAYHGLPEPEYWSRLDVNHTREMLTKMVDDQKLHTIVRARAMLALQYFRTDDTVNLIAGKAKGDSIAYMRSTAYEALVNSEGEKALKLVGEGLKDSDTMVRMSAIRSLKKIGGPEAKSMLEGNLKEESNPAVKSVMQRSLDQMK